MIEKGERFGKLVATGNHKSVRETAGNTYMYYECICDCGNTKYFRGTGLRYGQKKTCGCSKYDGKIHTKHGGSSSRLYRIWNALRTRCNKTYDQAYSYYGGRGIRVCPEWDNRKDGFENFEKWALNNGYSEELTIDRINVDGNYEPSNCKWATMKEQGKNKRSVKLYDFMNERMCKTEIARKLGVNERTFLGRCSKNGVQETISYYLATLDS